MRRYNIIIAHTLTHTWYFSLSTYICIYMYIRPGSSVGISFLVHIPFYLTMMTSSNGMFFRVTGPLCGEFTGHRWITLTKASDAEFDVFFDMRLNKQLSKQSGRRWFETPLRSLWHRCSVYIIYTAAFAITLRPYVQYKKKLYVLQLPPWVLYLSLYVPSNGCASYLLLFWVTHIVVHSMLPLQELYGTA